MAAAAAVVDDNRGYGDSFQVFSYFYTSPSTPTVSGIGQWTNRELTAERENVVRKHKSISKNKKAPEAWLVFFFIIFIEPQAFGPTISLVRGHTNANKDTYTNTVKKWPNVIVQPERC